MILTEEQAFQIAEIVAYEATNKKTDICSDWRLYNDDNGEKQCTADIIKVLEQNKFFYRVTINVPIVNIIQTIDTDVLSTYELANVLYTASQTIGELLENRKECT